MKKSNRSFIIFFVIVILGIGLLGYRTLFPTSGGVSSARVPCVNPALPVPSNLHIHPNLKIVIDGEMMTIPANTGIEPVGCHRVLHTHDGTGQIHVEPNFKHDFTLGDFFGVWNKPFSATAILDKIADESHEIVMTVDDEPNEEYENLILKDKQNIVIEYREK